MMSRMAVIILLASPFLPFSSLSSLEYRGYRVMAIILPQRIGIRNGRMIIIHQANSKTISKSLMVRSIL